MGINAKCPRCGSTQVQLSNETSKHGCLWFLLFGWMYVIYVICRWVIGFYVFIFYDWWMALIKRASDKGHVWQSKRFFSTKSRLFYCHACGHNFRG